MRCLDLFSGIGGFAYALKHISTPVMFSEIDGESIKILNKNFPNVPVNKDVTKLNKKDVQHLHPDIITAGFPCQDISCLRMQEDVKGIYGEQSRLFFEVPRLIKQIKSVKHVFLENSPCIYNRGLNHVIRALKASGMTHVAYGVFSAGSLGAVHSRRRWFCLASKSPNDLKIMSSVSLRKSLKNEWDKLDTYPRVIQNNTSNKKVKKRLSLLGNAVVPQCAAYAYQSLMLSITSNIKSLVKIQKTPIYKRTTILTPESKEPIDVYREPVQNRIVENKLFNLRMRDDNGKVTLRTRWRTPTSGEASWNQSRDMTDRALWNLANMIYYEENTHCSRSPDISNMSRHCIINPEFIEIMMGYPKEWTYTA